VRLDPVAASEENAAGDHHQHHHRQQMDRAEAAGHPAQPEAGKRRDQHQHRPQLAQQAMQRIPLVPDQHIGAERQCRQHGNQVDDQPEVAHA